MSRLPVPETIFNKTAQVGPRSEKIVSAIAARYRMPVREVRSDDRTRRVAVVRQHAMTALREAGFTVIAIGAYFDRDHTTVTHAFAAHRARVAWANLLIGLVWDRPAELARAA